MNVSVFKEQTVEFIYDTDRKELYQKWDGVVDSQLFRKAIDLVLELSYKYPIYYVISDTTTHESLSNEDGEYAAQITPQLFENGIKFTAFIMSEFELGRMAANRFSYIVKDVMNIGHFADIDGARNWVDQNRF